MKYEDMVAGVLVRVKGCPESEAIDAIRNACIEFCQQTYCLVSGAVVVSSAGQLTATAFGDMFIVDVIDARIDGRPIDVVPMNSDRVATASDTDPVIVFADPSVLQLVPAPSAPVDVDLMVVLAPGQTSTEVPDVLWQRYAEWLKHGALARLMAEPEKGWTNERTSEYHDRKFQDAITKQSNLSGKNRIHRAQRLRVQPA